jgi:hypothetical protein
LLQKRGVFGYYWLWFSTACRPSLDIAQTIIFVGFIALGAAAWSLKFLGLNTHFPDLTSWNASVGIIISVVCARLIYAPYLIFKEQQKNLHLQNYQTMRFVFPNVAGNLDSKITLFRETFRLLPDGVPIKHRLTLVGFFIGIENLTDRTLRNVRVVLDSRTIPPWPLSIELESKRTGNMFVDIQPKDTELFIFGEGYDSSDGSGVMIRQPLEVDKIAEHAAKIGFYLGSRVGGQHPLLKNDGYIIEFSAYADDVAAISGQAELNAKDRLEMRLIAGKHTFSPG